MKYSCKNFEVILFSLNWCDLSHFFIEFPTKRLFNFRFMQPKTRIENKLK